MAALVMGKVRPTAREAIILAGAARLNPTDRLHAPVRGTQKAKAKPATTGARELRRIAAIRIGMAEAAGAVGMAVRVAEKGATAAAASLRTGDTRRRVLRLCLSFYPRRP
jgi:hypothetical protein